jgi:hypothetical protein
MLDQKQFTHTSIYTEGLNVTETSSSITVDEGLIFYNDKMHSLESVVFTKETDTSYPVYYQLSIVDNDGVLEYDLERTIITPRHVPGYVGNNLIHVLVSFMLELDGTTTGNVTYVKRIGGEVDEEAQIN